jgi:hypothetical protein
MRTYLIILLTALALLACGGGGDSSSSTTQVSTVSLTTPAGTTCGTVDNALEQPIKPNSDVFGNLNFWVSSVIGSKPWSCLIVNKSDGQPVFDGNQSVRFEIRPGDCTAPDYTGISDCVNDRSRSEIRSINPRASKSSTQGQIITYEYRVYIPYQPSIRPAGSGVAVVLTQLRNAQSTDALAYLAFDDKGGLYLQTHAGFSFTPLQKVPIDSNPYNKWIKLKYVVKSTAASDGYVQIYVNDALVINETRATLPDTAKTQMIIIGIYDSFLSAATQPWQTQVVYFDGISTSVQYY